MTRGGGRADARSIAALALAVAAIALGYAVQRRNGLYQHTARNFLLVAIGAAAWAVGAFWPRLPISRRRASETGIPGRVPAPVPQPAFGSSSWELAFLLVGLGGIAYEFYTLLTASPGWFPAQHYPHLQLFRVGVSCAAALSVTALFDRPVLGRLHIPAVLLVYVLLGAWMVHAAPTPDIDVYYFHKEAYQALLAGRSPYSVTIPNIYGADAALFYGPGLVVGDRLQVAYPYPPLSLLLGLIGVVFGDYRYALVLAVAAAAALVAYLQPGRTSRVAAILLLFMPRAFFVFEQGWTDPYVVLGIAAIAFCAMRAWRLLPFALAFFLASKQYSLLALPLLPLLFGRHPEASDGWRGWRARLIGAFDWAQLVRVLCIALALAALVTLPFVLWDPRGFVRAVMLFQVQQPFRGDALSLLHGAAQHLHIEPTSAVTVVAGLVAIAFSLWRAPRSAGGFVMSLALTMLVFFAFAKQAFANYYFAVFGALLCAMALTKAEGSP